MPPWVRVQDCAIVTISTPDRWACPDFIRALIYLGLGPTSMNFRRYHRRRLLF